LRVVAFGSAAVLVIAGAACAATIEGVVGEVLTIVLISLGLGGGLLLVFLEIGLSEERELAQNEDRRRRRRQAFGARQWRRRGHWPRRPL